MGKDRPWLLYGAYGYTGTLIARQAAAIGLPCCSPDAGRAHSPNWPGHWACRGVV